MGRKFWLAIIYEVALLFVLAALLLLKQLNDLIFGAWLTAFAAGFVTYVMGNVAAKAPKP